MSAFGGRADSLACLAECLLLAISGHPAARPKSKIGCTEGGPARSVRHLSACRGGDSTAAVRRNPATDRRPATTARADMTPCVIAAVGLNRRVLGSRHLPNARLQIPDCTLAGSPTHRAPYLKAPIWIVGSRFRSIRNSATVFGAWEEPSGKSQLKRERARVSLVLGRRRNAGDSPRQGGFARPLPGKRPGQAYP